MYLAKTCLGSLCECTDTEKVTHAALCATTAPLSHFPKNPLLLHAYSKNVAFLYQARIQDDRLSL